jgi:DNA-directed RNA polymerase subunit RPC12/RpoP
MGIQRREAIVWSVECPGCGQTADLSVVFNGGIEASRALAGLRDYTTERYGVCPNCRKDVFVKMQTKDGDIVRADPVSLA